MNLDLNATYELTKVAVKNQDSRYVQLGDKTTGPAYMYGKSLVVGNIRTSNIVKTADQGDGKFLVETLNSLYTLNLVK